MPETRSEEGRAIQVCCTCPACMNEYHEATITMDGDTNYDGRVYTTWSEWKTNTLGEKYRDRVVAAVEVEGLTIPATQAHIEAWRINGIYTTGHVILDVAPSDPIDFPIDICSWM